MLAQKYIWVQRDDVRTSEELYELYPYQMLFGW